MSYENYVCKMQDKGFNIWTDLLVPVIISPLLLSIKILYDRYISNKDKNIEIRNTRELEKIQVKLSNFYWPLYIRLLKDYDIWSQFKIFDDEFYHYIDNDIDTNEDLDYDLPRCQFKYQETNDNIKSIKFCNNPVHRNSTYDSVILCHKHKNNLISENLFKTHQVNQINLENFVVTNTGERTFSGNFTGLDAGKISGITDHLKATKIILSEKIKKKMLEEMVINHNRIHDIIIENISLGEPNSVIGQELMKYLKFISIFRNIMDNHEINPVKYNSPYPKKLLPYIEKKVFCLQKKYNNLIEHFYTY